MISALDILEKFLPAEESGEYAVKKREWEAMKKKPAGPNTGPGKGVFKISSFGQGWSRNLFEGKMGNIRAFTGMFHGNGANLPFLVKVDHCIFVQISRFGHFRFPEFDIKSVGVSKVFDFHGSNLRSKKALWTVSLSSNRITLKYFPSNSGGAEIIKKTVEFRPLSGTKPDARLLKRRECEYEIFQSVEEAIELPIIRRGFSSVKEFIDRAQTVLQRRKSRSGRSLELHVREIFLEGGLSEGKEFSCQAESESGKRPDFIFPSSTAYQDPYFPESRLRMLAAKTTCKDRWRQILNEADRIRTKHLLTLQEGVSEKQFREMTGSGVSLVVPEGLQNAYPGSVRPHLVTLESFIGDIRILGSYSRYGGESIAAEDFPDFHK